MLEVQKYLLSGKSLQDLENEYGITAVHSEHEPLVILNYSINSPKLDAIACECRGLVLEENTWKVVAKPFSRFFNYGEAVPITEKFDWNNFSCSSKEDGSLILLYKYRGTWRCNTRNSFAVQAISRECGRSWEDMVFSQLNEVGLDNMGWDFQNLTLVCEFVSPHNKVVKQYNHPQLFLLTAINNEWPHNELSQSWTNYIAGYLSIEHPHAYPLKTIEEINIFLNAIGPTDEGVVIKDVSGLRLKIKNPRYLSLHRMKGKDNIFLTKNILPFVLKGDTDELLTYFPEVRPTLDRLATQVNIEYQNMMIVWEDAKRLTTQKEFALSIMGKTKFYSVLFQARKSGQSPQDIWKKSADTILKILF